MQGIFSDLWTSASRLAAAWLEIGIPLYYYPRKKQIMVGELCLTPGASCIWLLPCRKAQGGMPLVKNPRHGGSDGFAACRQTAIRRKVIWQKFGANMGMVMQGLKLRDEFLEQQMPGTAIQLRSGYGSGATEKYAGEILEITWPTGQYNRLWSVRCSSLQYAP